MKLNIMISAILLAAVSAVGCSSWGEVTVRISEEQLKDRLNNKFPITKTYRTFGTVTYENPRISLRRTGERVEFGLDIRLDSVQVNGKALHASVLMLVLVTYDSNEQALFLTEPHLEQLTLNGEQQQDAQALGALYMPAVKKLLKRKPIYRFKNQGGLEKIAGKVIKDIRVRNGCLEVLCGV
jgi:hypothetical protein